MFANKLDLSHHLIGKGCTHHEGGMARGAAQIHQTAFGEDRHAFPVRPFHLVNLRLDVDALQVLVVKNARDVDLEIEVPDVRDDRLVLHRIEMLDAG